MTPKINEYNYQASLFFADRDAKTIKKPGGVKHQMSGRMIADKTVKYILFISAILSIVIVLAIAFFIFRESLQAWSEIGFSEILFKAVWRPGQDQYGILAMIVGSVAVTIGAIVLGVPLALGSAIFLGEIAPKGVQAVLRPAVQLLAGIPSVVYGLFGMVVLVPLIRQINVPGNSGYGLMAASIVLAVMILPTIPALLKTLSVQCLTTTVQVRLRWEPPGGRQSQRWFCQQGNPALLQQSFLGLVVPWARPWQ